MPYDEAILENIFFNDKNQLQCLVQVLLKMINFNITISQNAHCHILDHIVSSKTLPLYNKT